MTPSLTDTLCTRCGLCCDGSLFADVELASRDETSALEVMGLDVEDGNDDEDVGVLLQPCGALKGKRCGIYPYRPDCCRTFECGLLQKVRCGAIGVDRAKGQIAEALQRIERVKGLVVELRPGDERLPLKERCVEALTRLDEGDVDPEMKRKRGELQFAMAAVEGLIQKTFLGG